jgi:hypothetical protein
VVIDDFDIFGVSIVPAKADSELTIDADAPLTATVALESFQPVAGRAAQGLNGHGGIQQSELTLGRADQI